MCTIMLHGRASRIKVYLVASSTFALRDLQLSVSHCVLLVVVNSDIHIGQRWGILHESRPFTALTIITNSFPFSFCTAANLCVR